MWKLPAFMISDDDIDGVLHKAGNHKAFVIDLRDNGGGAADNLTRLLGGVMDHEAESWRSRGGEEHEALDGEIARRRRLLRKGDRARGSRSASASELFARVVVLEKRGTVVGDRSAGAVKEALSYRSR